MIDHSKSTSASMRKRAAMSETTSTTTAPTATRSGSTACGSGTAGVRGTAVVWWVHIRPSK